MKDNCMAFVDILPFDLTHLLIFSRGPWPLHATRQTYAIPSVSFSFKCLEILSVLQLGPRCIER